MTANVALEITGLSDPIRAINIISQNNGKAIYHTKELYIYICNSLITLPMSASLRNRPPHCNEN